MFKLGQSDSFSYPVEVEVVGDGGKRSTYTFDAQFRRLPSDELNEISRRAREGDVNDAGLVREVLVGWKGILDEDGSELPFSEASRERVCRVWPVTPSIVAAFLEANSPKGKQKNSKP